METMAKRLLAFRQRKNLKIKDVAVAIGVAESTYREWELGREIRGEPYLRLAAALGVSLSELMGGEEGSRECLLRTIDEMEALIKHIRIHL